MIFVLFLVQVACQCEDVCVSLANGCMFKKKRCYDRLTTTLSPTTSLRPHPELDVHVSIDVSTTPVTTVAPKTLISGGLPKMVKGKTTRELLEECEATSFKPRACNTLRLQLLDELKAALNSKRKTMKHHATTTTAPAKTVPTKTVPTKTTPTKTVPTIAMKSEVGGKKSEVLRPCF